MAGSVRVEWLLKFNPTLLSAQELNSSSKLRESVEKQILRQSKEVHLV